MCRSSSSIHTVLSSYETRRDTQDTSTIRIRIIQDGHAGPLHSSRRVESKAVNHLGYSEIHHHHHTDTNTYTQ